MSVRLQWPRSVRPCVRSQGVSQMTLKRPNANDATLTSNRSRDVSPVSGICTRCVDGCRGNCEVFKASFRGREVIYPGPFGEITAGGDKEYPVDYSHLNIMGYALGAEAPGWRYRHPGQHALPQREHRDRVRLPEQGQDEGTGLHRRARLHGDRAQELGALRRWRRHQRDLARLRRERVRHRPAA